MTTANSSNFPKLHQCGEWDPCSIHEKFSADYYAIGTLAIGRDYRQWEVHPSPQGNHIWALRFNEKPRARKRLCSEPNEESESQDQILSSIKNEFALSQPFVEAKPEEQINEAFQKLSLLSSSPTTNSSSSSPSPSPSSSPSSFSSSSSSSSSVSAPNGSVYQEVNATVDYHSQQKIHPSDYTRSKKEFRDHHQKQNKVQVEIPLWKLGWWKWSTIKYLDGFCVRECGQGGDCLFASLATGLNELVAHCYFEHRKLTEADCETLTTIQGLRNLAAEQLTPEMIVHFLEDENQWRAVNAYAHAATMVNSTEHGKVSSHREASKYDLSPNHAYQWDSHFLLNVARSNPMSAVGSLKKIIQSLGNRYWGDTSTLELLCKSPLFQHLQIGFLLFKPTGIIDPVYITSVPVDQVRHLLLLYNDTNAHWRLVVYHWRESHPAVPFLRFSDKYVEFCAFSKEHASKVSESRPTQSLEQTVAFLLGETLPQALVTIMQTSWQKSWLQTLGFPASPN